MEPLIYTPLFIAKGADGASAIDLTQIRNRRYQMQRPNDKPQYAATLSDLTAYRPIDVHPTDHWLPQLNGGNGGVPGATVGHGQEGDAMPSAKGAGPRGSESWAKHFLDLYAPTPPPMLAPKVPRMAKSISEEEHSLAEVAASTAAISSSYYASLPSVLRRGERSQPLVMQSRIAFHDRAVEDDRRRRSVEVDMNRPAQSEQQDDMMVMIEEGVEMEESEGEMEDMDDEGEMEEESDEGEQ